MEGGNALICPFRKYGHCKFGDVCKHFYIYHTCLNIQCKDMSCKSRHPKSCKYFAKGICKFGNSCSCSHSDNPQDESNISSLRNEIQVLKTGLASVISLLTAKEDEISILKERLYPVENTVSSLNCQHCDFVSSSSAGLKIHMTKIHKHDKLREPIYESGSCISLSFEERAEHSRDENLIEKIFLFIHAIIVLKCVKMVKLLKVT